MNRTFFIQMQNHFAFYFLLFTFFTILTSKQISEEQLSWHHSQRCI